MRKSRLQRLICFVWFSHDYGITRRKYRCRKCGNLNPNRRVIT